MSNIKSHNRFDVESNECFGAAFIVVIVVNFKHFMNISRLKNDFKEVFKSIVQHYVAVIVVCFSEDFVFVFLFLKVANFGVVRHAPCKHTIEFHSAWNERILIRVNER